MLVEHFGLLHHLFLWYIYLTGHVLRYNQTVEATNNKIDQATKIKINPGTPIFANGIISSPY